MEKIVEIEGPDPAGLPAATPFPDCWLRFHDLTSHQYGSRFTSAIYQDCCDCRV